MTQQIKAVEYINYLKLDNVNNFDCNTIAFLVDMFHKAKYGDFLLCDVNYNTWKAETFWLCTKDQSSDLIISSKKAEEIYKLVMHHCVDKNSLWQIDTILCEKFDEIKNQDDAYRIFNEYIKDYILFRTLPQFKQE